MSCCQHNNKQKLQSIKQSNRSKLNRIYSSLKMTAIDLSTGGGGIARVTFRVRCESLGYGEAVFMYPNDLSSKVSKHLLFMLLRYELYCFHIDFYDTRYLRILESMKTKCIERNLFIIFSCHLTCFVYNFNFFKMNCLSVSLSVS